MYTCTSIARIRIICVYGSCYQRSNPLYLTPKSSIFNTKSLRNTFRQTLGINTVQRASLSRVYRIICSCICLAPTAPSYTLEEIVRTDMHSYNSGYFQILVLFRAFTQDNLAGISEQCFKCLTYETCTKSYVSHVDSIINL